MNTDICVKNELKEKKRRTRRCFCGKLELRIWSLHVEKRRTILTNQRKTMLWLKRKSMSVDEKSRKRLKEVNEQILRWQKVSGWEREKWGRTGLRDIQEMEVESILVDSNDMPVKMGFFLLTGLIGPC